MESITKNSGCESDILNFKYSILGGAKSQLYNFKFNVCIKLNILQQYTLLMLMAQGLRTIDLIEFFFKALINYDQKLL